MGWITPKDPHLTNLARVVTPALIVAESGTYHGVDWTIQPEHVRRQAYRVYVAGRYVATTGNRMAADALRKEWIDDLIEQGLAETEEPAL